MIKSSTAIYKVIKSCGVHSHIFSQSNEVKAVRYQYLKTVSKVFKAFLVVWFLDILINITLCTQNKQVIAL